MLVFHISYVQYSVFYPLIEGVIWRLLSIKIRDKVFVKTERANLCSKWNSANKKKRDRNTIHVIKG